MEWISIQVAQPTLYEDVLMIDQDSRYHYGEILISKDGSHFINECCDGYTVITHWMPLPPPPSEVLP